MAQTITTTILINAQVGSGFSKVGSTLTELGSLVNGLSQELISFGKDSIDVYRNYEKSMKDAEVALSTTYGRSTQQLSDVMDKLDVSATEWAATTIFHTNDVANAISEMAHAGWDYEKIMAGMPAAMELAQAGGLDLSEAVNYIVKSTNSLGIESVKDVGNFIDIWAYAANSSASTIGQFGDAMLRMGSSMRFAANPEELMTLIAVTANAGQTGSEAGTLIRNSMMRLVAPTDKAKKAMAELGATTLEASELLEDEALAAANARLEASGFSAFDEEGNLKNVLDIYRELYMSLGEVAGGFENIEKNQDALEILSSIFPTRTITEALTLLRGAADGYDELYEAMRGGAAEGYGEYAAETMMNSLDGSIRIFESKVERLKQVTGGTLAPQLESILGWFGGIVDSIAEMDSGKFNAIVSSLEVLAGAGPALLATGGALRIIGGLMTPAGSFAAGAIALTMAAAAVKELNDAEYESHFGDMELDEQSIRSFTGALSEGFREAYSEIDTFRGEVQAAVDEYTSASSQLSRELFSKVITGETLSEGDISRLQSLGEQMYSAVEQGIESSTAASGLYWQMLFGGEEAAEGNINFQNINQVLAQGYEEAIAGAQENGQRLRNAMTAAFSDGQVSDEEYQQILEYMRSYNEAMARAAQEVEDEERQISLQMTLNSAQGASLDSLNQFSETITSQRDEVLAKEDEEFEREYAALQVKWRKAIEGGQGDEGEMQNALAQAQQRHEERKLSVAREYNNALMRLWDEGLKGSSYAGSYERLSELQNLVGNGAMDAEAAWAMFLQEYGGGRSGQLGSLFGGSSEKTQVGDTLRNLVDMLGGEAQVSRMISGYEEAGDTEAADMLRNVFQMSRISGSQSQAGVYGVGEAGTGGYTVESARSAADATGEEVRNYLEQVAQVMERGDISPESKNSLIQPLEKELSDGARQVVNGIVKRLDENYDLENAAKNGAPYTNVPWTDEKYQKTYGARELMYGGASRNTQDYKTDQEETQPVSVPVVPQIDESATLSMPPATMPVVPEVNGESPDMEPVPLPVVPHVEGEDPAEELRSQGVQVQIDGDISQLQATIDGADGQTLMEYIDGDASGLEATISSVDGRTVVANITGNASSIAQAIDQYNGRTITVNIQGRKLFASGGRATEASVFGEAGPEWAIPEEHSERTAGLLNAAREASGFSWQDLLERYGGLNSNVQNTGATLIYSPTINANDVSGVEQALIDDKERLDRWYEEKQMRDEMEVYA